MIKNRYFNILLCLIFFGAFFLRFYKLGEIPFGFYQDESAIGYNAYSIEKTAKDEYGVKFPVYFKSFGDYKLPVYVYSAILPIKIFGLNEFSVRFVSALFGFLTVVIVYFFVKSLTQDKKLAVTATILMAINPWHLHYSRAAFEVSQVLFFYVTGFYLLHCSLLKKKRWVFLAGTLCFIISLYTYNLTRLLSPVLFFYLLVIYRKHLNSVSKKEITATIILSLVLLFPFFITLFTNGGLASARGTLIFSSAVIQAGIIEFRSYLTSLPVILNKIMFNNLILTLFLYLKNITSYLSTEFFFLSGSSHGNHGIGNVGQFYIFELPLMLIGWYRLIKEKNDYKFLIIGWVILTILVASLTREAPHATRSFSLIFPLGLISATGLLVILQYLLRQTNNKIKTVLFAVLFLTIIYNIGYYFSSYYLSFPIKYAKAWRSVDKELSLYLAKKEKNFDVLIVDRNANYIYTSYLFYNKYDPVLFQNTVKRSGPDNEGFDEVLSFGKIRYQKINREQDLISSGKKLFITSNVNMNLQKYPSVDFYYPQRPVVIASKENILQYPVREIAYKVYEIE